MDNRQARPDSKAVADRFDIIVAGGGLVGSALALALARHGLEVALLDPVAAEARADPEFDGRAYAVAPGSANLLRAVAVWQAIEDRAQPVRHIAVEDRSPGPVPPAALHFDPTEGEQPVLGWIVEDRWLRGALLEALAEAAGIDHRAPALPSAVRLRPGAAEVDVGGETLRAAAVIACDGRRSATARAAGIRYLSWDYPQTGLVCAVEHALPHEARAHQAFFPGGPFAQLPLPGNRSSIVWSERRGFADEVGAMDDDAYTAEIARRLGGRLGEVRLAGRRWVYPLGLSLATSYARPRLAVCGDAAHGVHPIAGQGLNMGLRDVAALTQVLVEAARKGEDPGVLDVLRRYERWRRFDATAMTLGMDGLNRLFSTGAGPVQAVRNAGLRIVGGLAPARRFFMAEAAGLSGDVPRLLAGQSI
jgi:2-octaprenyl-6-methoxyphenol hydroxylase